MKIQPDYPSSLRPIDHFDLAYQFFHSYQFAAETRPPNWPRYFLACHAVELVLKAFLLQRGLSEIDTKNYGHNLCELLSRSITEGLELEDEVKADISALNEVHRDFWHRYPRMVGTPVQLVHQFEPSLSSLFSKIQKFWNPS